MLLELQRNDSAAKVGGGVAECLGEQTSVCVPVPPLCSCQALEASRVKMTCRLTVLLTLQIQHTFMR